MTIRKNKRVIFILLSMVVMLTLTVLTSFTLIKTGNRQKTCLLTQSKKVKVDAETKGMDVEQIIDYSLQLTASRLQFSVNNDINNGKANCVGYSQLCAGICNQALATNGINGQAKAVVGYIESNRINWCDVLKAIFPKNYKNFVKDHDFVELVTESKTYYFDPSIYDVLGLKCPTIKSRL